ncbi:PLP-dependent aminotransferase family protein [Chitinophaga horti]|uniref:PLP-dependent aminotransferase family protein n=1 Tax=Chitinophaga horti TaxID=2920382 RepID=A0ABY6J958_9BACT|nr:PLP-dependent aminotransferase family protein [Chitinophaga horti]UYQ95866.1 PLP-dependent aminotransferase family protein [Chitinophaga horti]
MLRPWKLKIQLDPQSEKAIYLQLADAIIADIRSGRLKGGTALPGSRALANELQLNRNTIVEALNVLLNEEWIISRERKGTFVAEELPILSKRRSGSSEDKPREEKAPLFHIIFDDGAPDSKIAPIDELVRAYRQIFKQKGRWQMMGYGCEYGEVEFRGALAQMLNHQRGMQVDADKICVTRGSQMAMYLTAHCLLTKGDAILIETPGYKPAWKAFEATGATLLPVRVDKDGLLISDVETHLQSGKRIKALYTTPHHQYPTTVTLSLQRRLELVRLSNEHGFTIIEDDYDNEFHFGYRPVLPICSFEGMKNFVYIGTMSKVVAPALRIGYLVCGRPALLDKAADLRKIIDVQGDTIMEQAVLQLINDGTIKRHLKRATGYYRSKRDFTAGLLQTHLAEKALFDTPDGGLAFWVLPNKKTDWPSVSKKLQAKGIKIITPEQYSFGKMENGIRLSYGSLSEKQLEEGIAALGRLL